MRLKETSFGAGKHGGADKADVCCTETSHVNNIKGYHINIRQ